MLSAAVALRLSWQCKATSVFFTMYEYASNHIQSHACNHLTQPTTPDLRATQVWFKDPVGNKVHVSVSNDDSVISGSPHQLEGPSNDNAGRNNLLQECEDTVGADYSMIHDPISWLSVPPDFNSAKCSALYKFNSILLDQQNVLITCLI